MEKNNDSSSSLSSNDDEIEDEPRLKYRRLANDLLEILRCDSISAFLAHERFIAVGTSNGKIILCDHDGNMIQDVTSHTGEITCLKMDMRAELIASSSIDGGVKILSLFGDAEIEQKMKFRSAIWSVAIAPDYASSGKVVIASEKITLCERGLLGSKKSTVLAVGVVGKVSQIEWKYDLITWADTKDVKVFDLVQREVISIIPKQNAELSATEVPANFLWNDKKMLIIGWGDFVQVCAIKMRQGSPKIEIQQMFKTDFLIAGLTPIADELLVMAFEARGKPSMRIIVPEVTQYSEKCCDTLTIRGYSNYTGENYRLCAHLIDDTTSEKCFFIVSPKDIIVAIEPDDDDHVTWLLENEQFVEALKYTENRKLTKHSYNVIGRDYIRFLIEDDQLELAAQKCKSFLFTSQEWEREAMAFSSKDSLRLLVPVLPIQTPQLRSSIYGEALREFIEAKEYDQYLKWIKSWPCAIYEIKQQTFLIRQEVDKLMIRNEESDELTVALRILLEADHRYEEAFDIFIRLSDSDIFRFINQHYLYNEEWIKSNILKLMEVNVEQCSNLLIAQKDAFPIRSIVEILKEQSQYLHHYLHNLYISDQEKLPPEYHDLQVVLYANYDRSKLMAFLKSSPHYEERDALDVVEKKEFCEEQVYLLARMGKKSEALDLLLRSSDSIDPAVDFCLSQNDHELWRELIDLSVTNPQHIKSLLKTVGQYVDPLLIIERIPEGLEIPGLRDALQVVLRDSTDRQSMWRSTERISATDGLKLISKLFHKKRAAIFVDKGVIAKCAGCLQTVLDEGKIRGKRALIFGCGHVSHASCVIDHSNLRRSMSEEDGVTISTTSSAVGYERCPACERSSG